MKILGIIIGLVIASFSTIICYSCVNINSVGKTDEEKERELQEELTYLSEKNKKRKYKFFT